MFRRKPDTSERPLCVAEAEECARRVLTIPAESIRAIAQRFVPDGSRAAARRHEERERFRGLASELASLYAVSRKKIC